MPRLPFALKPIKRFIGFDLSGCNRLTHENKLPDPSWAMGVDLGSLIVNVLD
jgi:hypothetical protein